MTIYKILFNIRKVIAEYLKNEYRLKQIGGDPTLHKIVAIDESLLLHDEKDMQIWLVGAVDPETKALRLDIAKDRTSETLKSFVYNYRTWYSYST